MNHQKKLLRHHNRKSSFGETASVGSLKSLKSNGSGEYSKSSSSTGQASSASAKSSQLSSGSRQSSQDGCNGSKSDNILNVAEMLLHGVADHEIIDIWLRSIQCEEFVSKIIESGYDMPTLSRITPQDLTAIGVTEPAKRLKILTEIKKLNLQDGIPTFRPTSLSHWLSLIRLSNPYYKLLCDQQIDTIEKMSQLTWEDFEDLGITKLGHQKRFQLAIERLKEIDANDPKGSVKPIAEPIYDTNPSQILLVASAENHSMNGPIINKQSSTGELSSTDTGSVQSVYSAASNQYQSSHYAPLPCDQISDASRQSMIATGSDNPSTQSPHMNAGSSNRQPSVKSLPVAGSSNVSPQQPMLNSQPIYSQGSSMIYQQPISARVPNNQHISSAQSHYQPAGSMLHQSQVINNTADHGSIYSVAPQHTMHSSASLQQQNQSRNNTSTLTLNRQSMNQLPFSALANLPRHQQEMLQQTSIYATLSRQPNRSHKQPPPVPIRRDSLKSNSITDEVYGTSQQVINKMMMPSMQMQPPHHFSDDSRASSTASLYRYQSIMGNRTSQQAPQQPVQLSKHKSFNGNAQLEATRARFLQRQSQQPPQLPYQQATLPPNNLPHQIRALIDSGRLQYNSNQIYGTMVMRPSGTNAMNNIAMLKQPGQNQPQVIDHFKSRCDIGLPDQRRPLEAPPTMNGDERSKMDHQSMTSQIIQRSEYLRKPNEDLDMQSDSTSTRSLVMPSSSLSMEASSSLTVGNKSANGSASSGCTQDSGSDQTLYNSASSGSHDGQSFSNIYGSSGQAGDVQMRPTNEQRNNSNAGMKHTNSNAFCNATLGKDDDFPPPPSPLSFEDCEDHDPTQAQQQDNTYASMNVTPMSFKVGI